MSATRDKSQKTTFVYSNLYQLYRKGKEAAQKAEAEPNPSFHVLKTGDLKAPKIEEFTPPEFIGKRIEQAESAKSQGLTLNLSPVAARVLSTETVKMTEVQNRSHDSALASLKQNVQTLQDLHSRLRFMLKELEELSRDE
jgi:hypothetical protein